jgi:Putative zinc- or iron-chelating domain
MDNKLDQIYKQIPSSSCPPNCGKCCGIIYPSKAEISNIKMWLKERGREYLDFNMTIGLDCPYLSQDKSCSIYPVRPFLCRILGVSIDLPCPLKLNKPLRVINHQVSGWCYTKIYLQGKERQRTEKHRRELNKLLKDAGL